ncbi:MAG: hypothetical protein AB7F19_03475 [Candidatus Babeliales bacterium]
MQTIDVQKFYKLLYYGEFAQAHVLAKHLNLDELWQVMIAINYEKPSILSYGYVIAVLIQKETAGYHYLASRILIKILNEMEGAYAAGFWHAKRALELETDNIDYKMQIINFYSLPGNLLDKRHAALLAQEILEIDPSNYDAIEILKQNN